MPYTVSIDHGLQRVSVDWHGALDDAELVSFIDSVWNDDKLREYDGLMDMTDVSVIEIDNADIRHLAEYSRQRDNPFRVARAALVTPPGLLFGLARMFTSMREQAADERREWQVFTELEQALIWLGGVR
jgi:hypothetical protein